MTHTTDGPGPTPDAECSTRRHAPDERGRLTRRHAARRPALAEAARSLATILACSASLAAQEAPAPPTVLVPAPAAVGASVGHAVALDGDTLVLGAIDDDGAAPSSGAAYVYGRDRHDGHWTLEAQLTGTPDFAWFGRAVDVDGDTVVVGAPFDDHAGASSGAVHLFARDGAGWRADGPLLPDDATAGQHLGDALALDRDVLLVGAPFDDGAGTDAGAAYVFRRVGGAWVQEARLLAPTPAAFTFFGESVALDGDVAAVGSPVGEAVDVYTRRGGAWSHVQRLAAPAPGFREFGRSLALEHRTLAVGAPMDDRQAHKAGAAFVFRHASGGWSLEQTLRASDYDVEEEFGHAVALRRRTILVGAPFAEDSAQGAVYRFHRTGGAWSERDILRPTVSPTAFFGYAVDLDGDHVLIGAPSFEDFTGTCCPGAGHVVPTAGFAAGLP